MEDNNTSQEKLITPEDVKEAKAGKIKLKGKMTAEALKVFLKVRGGCQFSEAMAEGTGSWINAATVDLDLSGVDLSEITGLDEAKALLKNSLDKDTIRGLVEAVHKGAFVSLEDQYIKICFEI